jgi:hypothetical protein
MGVGKNIAHTIGIKGFHSGMKRRESMVPGFIMWLLGVPLVVIVLLFLFHVI